MDSFVAVFAKEGMGCRSSPVTAFVSLRFPSRRLDTVEGNAGGDSGDAGAKDDDEDETDVAKLRRSMPRLVDDHLLSFSSSSR